VVHWIRCLLQQNENWKKVLCGIGWTQGGRLSEMWISIPVFSLFRNGANIRDQFHCVVCSKAYQPVGLATLCVKQIFAIIVFIVPTRKDLCGSNEQR